jgi:hypothetical protein
VDARIILLRERKVNTDCENQMERRTVNPKFEMSPYLRKIQSSPRRSLASVEFSEKSKNLHGCGSGSRLKQLRLYHLRLLLFLFTQTADEEAVRKFQVMPEKNFI